MSVAIKLAKWVQEKPIVLIQFDDEYSEHINNSRHGFERLTIAKPHSFFQECKLPTLCILEIKQKIETKCYLAVATKKTAVSTFDSRLTIKKLRAIHPNSLQELEALVTESRMKRLLTERLTNNSGITRLSPKLSAHLIEILAKNPNNQSALDTVFSLLPGLRDVSDNSLAQEDAIRLAMNVFGVHDYAVSGHVVLKKGASSGLGLIGTHLYEDNVVCSDASSLPGFDTISSLDVTGKAVFQKYDERLIIYTANKLPLEEMLGVDLIYVNETRGNIIMVQYKMLEEAKGNCDWIFRTNKQLDNEIARMRLPNFEGTLSDYRLNSNPFFFKFVKRKREKNKIQSFLVSLDHLSQLLATPESKGLRGGIRLSYEALNGTYLRENDIISLIRSGYIGTHKAETEALSKIIEEVSKGNRAVVLAWQQRIQEISQ